MLASPGRFKQLLSESSKALTFACRMVKLEKDHLLASPGGAQGQPLVAVTAALHVAACIADSLGGQLLSGGCSNIANLA